MHRLSRKYAELTEVRCWCSGSHNYLSLLLPLPAAAAAAAAVRSTICAGYGVLLLLFVVGSSRRNPITRKQIVVYQVCSMSPREILLQRW